jgi:hypothetical protein
MQFVSLTGLLRSREGRPQDHRIANSVQVVQDGRVCIELTNRPFLFRDKATPDEYKAGLDLAMERGGLKLDRSGTFVPVHTSGLRPVRLTLTQL